MGVFNMSLTDKGKELLAIVNSDVGEVLHYTKVELGTGTVAGDEWKTFTELKEFWINGKLGKIERIGEDKTTVAISVQFTNAGQTTDHYHREIGLYAKGKNSEEVLFAYGNSGTTADLIPAVATSPQGYSMSLQMAVTSESQVTGNIDGTAFVMVADFEELQEKVEENASKLENLDEKLTYKKHEFKNDRIEVTFYEYPNHAVAHVESITGSQVLPSKQSTKVMTIPGYQRAIAPATGNNGSVGIGIYNENGEIVITATSPNGLDHTYLTSLIIIK